MKIRIINNFHNVDATANLKGNFTLDTYKRHIRKGCTQKDCKCETRIYREVDYKHGDLHDKASSKRWKRVDPTDLELRDAGYGVRI